MKASSILTNCLFILFSSFAANAAKVDDYAQAWSLTLPGESAAWQIELTPDVYAAISDPQLRDLEVLDSAGNAVPFAAYAAENVQRTSGALIDIPTFTLPTNPHASAPANGVDESIRLHIERAPDGKLRQINAAIGDAKLPASDPAAAQGDLVLDTSAIHEPLDSLRLDWADNGVSVTAQFAISASDDLQSWRTIATNATVLRLLQDGSVLDRHDIGVNGNHSSYLRLHRLDDGPTLPNLVVRARTASHSTIERPARQWLNATQIATVAVQPSARAEIVPAAGTIYDYHLPAALTVRALKLELVADNSLAHVRALSRVPSSNATPAPWNVAADFVAFRLRQGDALLVNDEIPIANIQRTQDWRIELTTPLDQVPQLRVAFVPDRFVFLAQGQGPYRLVAGSARARRGDYPVSAALATLRTNLGKDWQPPLATLGARATLQGELAMVPVPPAEPTRDWKTWLLWGVLIGAAALVGGLALSLLRKQS